jgi:L-ascorbate metabolism protein UlaG (beta-lactamase superfamily)
MNISWLGLSAFEIEAKNAEASVNVVIDPYQNTSGLRFPRTLEAAIVLSSRDHEDQNNLETVSGTPFIIDAPGEFEIQGVFVYGIEAPLKGEKEGETSPHTIFRIETEGMSVAHLGALNRELTDKELEQLPSIDILMVPVGGNDVMTPEQAQHTIERIEPRIVIPMYYAIPNVKQTLSDLKSFLKLLGGAKTEELPKLKIKKSDLPADETVLKILTRA